MKEYLEYVKRKEYDEEILDNLNMILLSTALSPSSAETYHGLVDHMSSVFVDGLEKTMGEKWYCHDDHGLLLTLFAPWLQLLSSCDNAGIVHHLIDDLFENLIVAYVRIRDLSSNASSSPSNPSLSPSLSSQKESFFSFLSSLDEAVSELARHPDTLERNRKHLYSLHSTLQLNLADPSQKQKSSHYDRQSKNKQSIDESSLGEEIPSRSSKKRDRSSSTLDSSPSTDAKKSKRSEEDIISTVNKKKKKEEEVQDDKKAKSSSKSSSSSSQSSKSQNISKSSSFDQDEDDGEDDGLLGSDFEEMSDEEAMLAAINDEFGSDDEDQFAEEMSEEDEESEKALKYASGKSKSAQKKKSTSPNKSPSSPPPPHSSSSSSSSPSRLVKMTPTRPEQSGTGSQKSKSPKSPQKTNNNSASPISSPENGTPKRVSFHGSQELTKKHAAKRDSPTPKGILKPRPAGPFSLSIDQNTSFNSHTDFVEQPRVPPGSQRTLAHPRKMTNTQRKLLIKQTMLHALGKK